MNDASTNEDIKYIPNEQYKKTRINFVFLCAIVIIIAITCLSIFQINNLINANRWVMHTYQVMSAAHGSLYHVSYLESQQRGYLLFGDQKFSENEADVVLKTKKILALLINLTKDNQVQNARAIRLSALVNKRIDMLNDMVHMKLDNKLASQEAANLFHQGQLSMDEIRSLVNQIVGVESVYLIERNNSAIQNANITNIVFISGQAISIISLLIAFILLNRELSKRRHAENMRKNTETQLRSIIEGATDMIAALDVNYKYIIFNHAYEKEFKRLFGKQLMVGMSLDEALVNLSKDANKLRETWRKSFETNEYTQNIELDDNGQRNIYEITSSLIKNNNNDILGAVHIKRNITERIKSQNELSEGMSELKDKNEKITLLLEMSDIILVCNSIEELSDIIAKYCGKNFKFLKWHFLYYAPIKKQS